MLGMPAGDINVYSSKDSKCPSCGGKLVFDPVGQVLKCGFCGNTYTPEKLELLNLLPEIDKGAAGEKEDDKCAIVCDNCGAELITDKNTSATCCSFCGSPARKLRRFSAEHARMRSRASLGAQEMCGVMRQFWKTMSSA